MAGFYPNDYSTTNEMLDWSSMVYSEPPRYNYAPQVYSRQHLNMINHQYAPTIGSPIDYPFELQAQSAPLEKCWSTQSTAGSIQSIESMDGQQYLFYPTPTATVVHPKRSNSSSETPVVAGHGILSESDHKIVCECKAKFEGKMRKNVRSNYKRHVNSQIEKFVCQVCSRDFNREDNLRQHNKSCRFA